MLLNPADYEFEYYHQARDYEGDSGPIHMGIPKRNDLCRILVKDSYVSDAINEYIACNIGQRIGVNTPRAWLFEQDVTKGETEIQFDRAVAIEYLEGLDDSVKGSYDTEDLAVQTIEGILLHLLMTEQDGKSLARYNGKVYAYDFATSLYHQFIGKNLPDRFYTQVNSNGLYLYEDHIIGKENLIRKSIRDYFEFMEKIDLPDHFVERVYEGVKDRFVEVYNHNGFQDMIQEIGLVFSEEAALFVEYLLASMDHALVYAFNSDHIMDTRLYIGINKQDLLSNR